MEATEQAPATEQPPAEQPSFEDTVLSLLTEMSSRLTKQEERLDAVEQQKAPQFIEPLMDKHMLAADRSQQTKFADPDGIPKSQTIPLFPNGQRVPDMVMGQYRPMFGSGDTVQLNLDAVPYGRTDDRTRGELMSEQDVPNGYGKVLDRTFLSATVGKGWKYRVKFDSKVMPGSNGGIVYLYEKELLPA